MVAACGLRFAMVRAVLLMRCVLLGLQAHLYDREDAIDGIFQGSSPSSSVTAGAGYTDGEDGDGVRMSLVDDEKLVDDHTVDGLISGDSEEIDFSGLHLDTKTHIASQWDGFIDTKTTYNHFLNMTLNGTIGLPSTPLRFACATHQRSWTEHMGRARICHSRHERTWAPGQRLPSPNKGHHTANKQGAQHAKLWKRSRSHSTGGTRYMDSAHEIQPYHFLSPVVSPSLSSFHPFSPMFHLLSPSLPLSPPRYEWGDADAANPAHSDLLALQTLIMGKAEAWKDLKTNSLQKYESRREEVITGEKSELAKPTWQRLQSRALHHYGRVPPMYVMPAIALLVVYVAAKAVRIVGICSRYI